MRGGTKLDTSMHLDIQRALLEVGELVQRETEAELRPWVQNYFRHHFERLAQDTELCVSLADNHSRLLDVGSAPFFTVITLHRLGYDITGVDVAPQRFEKLLRSAEVNVKRCDLEDEPLPFESESFDLILFSEVIEHLRIDVISTVSEIHRVLKPTGYLLCSTANLLEFRRIARLLLHGETFDTFAEYDKLRTLGHMGHVREYTARDLVKFMSKMGFRCERILYRGVVEWQPRPTALVRAVVHRLLPPSRKWFMLLLTREPKGEC